MSQKQQVKELAASVARVQLAKKKDDDEEEEDEDEEEDEENEDDEEDEEEENVEMPKSLIRRVTGLKKMQDEYKEITAAYKAERIALEKKYASLREPLYARRLQVIQGEQDFDETVFEVKEGEVNEDFEGYKASTEEGADLKGIPGFWFNVLSGISSVRQVMGENDEEVLNALVDIRCVVNESYTGYDLVFIFSENEFFENTEIVKSYVLSPDLIDETESNLESVNCTEINWKPGKNLLVKDVTKKIKTKAKKAGKKKGNANDERTVTVSQPQPSFFHFFAVPKDEDQVDEDEDEDEGSMGRNPYAFTTEDDYDIAHALRVTCIPEAILWYTGDKDEESDYDDFEDGDENEDEDDGQPLGRAPKKPIPWATAPGAGAAGDKPPDCKQN